MIIYGKNKEHTKALYEISDLLSKLFDVGHTLYGWNTQEYDDFNGDLEHIEWVYGNKPKEWKHELEELLVSLEMIRDDEQLEWKFNSENGTEYSASTDVWGDIPLFVDELRKVFKCGIGPEIKSLGVGHGFLMTLKVFSEEDYPKLNLDSIKKMCEDFELIDILDSLEAKPTYRDLGYNLSRKESIMKNKEKYESNKSPKNFTFDKK